MVRRIASTVALVACVGIYSLSAAQRATLILSNGQRVTGELAARGADAATYVDGQINLDGGGGATQGFPIDSVAIIDLAGGTPEPIELSRLPETGQCVVLRSGHNQSGKFVNIVHGETLLWDYHGEQQQYPLRDVARVYLNAPAARTALNVVGAESRAVGTSGASGAQTRLQAGAVRVNANQPWNDTGIEGKSRRSADVSGNRADQFCGGQRTDCRSRRTRRLGRADQSRRGDAARRPDWQSRQQRPFPIGSNTQPIRMPAKGRLMLGVNDGEVRDNAGFFSVVVTKR